MSTDVPTPKYWTRVEDTPTLQAELALIPDGSRVLEVGTAAGHMTQALVRKGCLVVGLEIDEAQASLAAPFCSRMIVDDLERVDLDTALPDTFDVVLCGDVLEHLRDPAAALAKLKRRLAPEGAVVASIPNVAHGSVRLSLLQGRFPYSQFGLLDTTHLKLFTVESIVELFNSVGLEIRDVHRTRVGLFDSEIPLVLSSMWADVVRRIVEDPESTSYQFVFRAVASGRGARLVDVRDVTFDPVQERRRFAADAMTRAWIAFHDYPPRLSDARVWARLALAALPSVKALLYWAVSFVPQIVWRLSPFRSSS
jgi:2-polyprenyl-3-methyl-5-hydroxy-6-metoxy-1,4-benzoquinol methylase